MFIERSSEEVGAATSGGVVKVLSLEGSRGARRGYGDRLDVAWQRRVYFSCIDHPMITVQLPPGKVPSYGTRGGVGVRDGLTVRNSHAVTTPPLTSGFMPPFSYSATLRLLPTQERQELKDPSVKKNGYEKRGLPEALREGGPRGNVR